MFVKNTNYFFKGQHCTKIIRIYIILIDSNQIVGILEIKINRLKLKFTHMDAPVVHSYKDPYHFTISLNLYIYALNILMYSAKLTNIHSTDWRIGT
jgi:hypothetical protein